MSRHFRAPLGPQEQTRLRLEIRGAGGILEDTRALLVTFGLFPSAIGFQTIRLRRVESWSLKQYCVESLCRMSFNSTGIFAPRSPTLLFELALARPTCDMLISVHRQIVDISRLVRVILAHGAMLIFSASFQC